MLKFLADAMQHRWQPTAAQLRTWTVLLADIPPKDLQVAAIQLVQESEYPPTVAALRRLASPVTALAGEEAFELARKAARHASPYSDARCEEAMNALRAKDPLLAEVVVAFGGFSAFWRMDNEMIPAIRAQFRGAWDAALKRRDDEKAKASALALMQGGALALPKET